VDCAPGFDKPPAVINGFTDLVLEVWGPDAGRHARSAIGAAQLPFGVPVEVEAIVEVA
jgi:enamine deaminase RidA (YjgF/YER057c/UK114 family)